MYPRERGGSILGARVIKDNTRTQPTESTYQDSKGLREMEETITVREPEWG